MIQDVFKLYIEKLWKTFQINKNYGIFDYLSVYYTIEYLKLMIDKHSYICRSYRVQFIHTIIVKGVFQ